MSSDDEMEYGSAEEEVALNTELNENADDDYIEEEDDEYEEEDDDEEYGISDDSDAGNVFFNLVASSSRHQHSGQLNDLPHLADYNPEPLQNEFSDEMMRRTGALAPTTPSKGSSFKQRRGSQPIVNMCQLLNARQAESSSINRLTVPVHCAAFHRVPHKPTKIIDRMESRGYIGQFSQDGEVFIAAFQNQKRVRMYDVNRGWRLVKDVHARNLRWTVTDISLSHDQKFMLYSSITPVVNLVNVERGAPGSATESIANVTDIHESLQLGQETHSNGIWSLQWSPDSTEIIAGTADNSLYIYDVAKGKTVVRLHGHDDDVNAVRYCDDTGNIILTGSDDNLIKIWDRRLVSNQRGTPVGVFVGHTEGISHIDAKGDGRYFISNSKDQTIKLWDVRAAVSPRVARQTAREGCLSFQWDYRWMQYPAADRIVKHEHDGSLATYRGHAVLTTLVRSYFSPAHTTGQRFIYTASADGSPRIYDSVTCREVAKLAYHREPVRDISWHPYLPLIATVAFDGSVCMWEPDVPGESEAAKDEAVSRAKTAARGAKEKRDGSLPAPGMDQLHGVW